MGQGLLLDAVTCSGFWERAGKVLKAELGQRGVFKILLVEQSLGKEGF